MFKNIVFDIGNVLFFTEWERVGRALNIRFHVDPEHAVKLFFGGGWNGRSLEHFLNLSEGTEEEFLAIAAKEFGVKLDPESFWDAWNSQWVPNVPMLSLVERLRNLENGPRLVICSNINKRHWEYLRRTMTPLQKFHQYALSYRVGAMKPDERMFKECDAPPRTAVCDPRQMFFIDDRRDNVLAARRLDWKAWEYDHGGYLEHKRLVEDYLRSQGVAI